MNNVIKKYKEEIKKIINDKKYIISIIITAILGYGYLITHTTIGMDDTALDIYYADLFEVNIISIVGRWGSYFLYRLLGITNFTPFWLEMMTVLTFIMTAMVITAFINKNFKPKSNLVGIVFSCIYISYSLINEAMIFQPSNFALIVGNLLTFISLIYIYEIFNGNYKKKYYIYAIIILTLGISMYEACCQTFLAAVFSYMIYNLINKNKENNIKFFLTTILILVCSIILNYIVLYTLFFIGVPDLSSEMMGDKSIEWFKYGLIKGISTVISNIKYWALGNVNYFPILEFGVCIIIGFLIAIGYSIKNKDTNIFNTYILLLGSNFALCILQCSYITYRTCTSWSFFVAIVVTALFIILYRKAYLKKIAIILCVLIVLWQTKDLNQWFYNEYVRYQTDLKDAYKIANDIEKEVDNLDKPIVFAGMPNKGMQTVGQIGAQSNGLSVVWWGKKAFNNNGNELIKFINHLGYYYIKPNDEQCKKGEELSKDMPIYPKEGYIKEFDDIIVVKFNNVIYEE